MFGGKSGQVEDKAASNVWRETEPLFLSSRFMRISAHSWLKFVKKLTNLPLGLNCKNMPHHRTDVFRLYKL